jgi:solute carrier family 35, member F1/2
MLVASDHLTNKDYPAVDRVKGDIFMLVGATLYGFSASLAALFTCELFV